MKHRILTLSAACAFLVTPLTAMAENAALAKAESYLSTLTTLSSSFMQEAPDGSTSTGKFYLQRPGKMRFEYDPPVPVVMVSTGRTLSYYDSELDQLSTIPLGDSLAGFIAQEVIDLDDETLEILQADEKDGILTIKLRQKEKPDEGALLMEFSTAPMQLIKLITTDASGQDTHIALQDAIFGKKLDKKLFQPPHKSVFKK